MARRVALIAVNAVVDISRNIFVPEIARIVSSVAARALEDGIVVRVRVAGGAHAVSVAMIDGELRILRVIEGGARPCGGVVAVLTCRWEELRLRRMARIARLVVVVLMASDAGRW